MLLSPTAMSSPTPLHNPRLNYTNEAVMLRRRLRYRVSAIGLGENCRRFRLQNQSSLRTWITHSLIESLSVFQKEEKLAFAWTFFQKRGDCRKPFPDPVGYVQFGCVIVYTNCLKMVMRISRMTIHYRISTWMQFPHKVWSRVRSADICVATNMNCKLGKSH